MAVCADPEADRAVLEVGGDNPRVVAIEAKLLLAGLAHREQGRVIGAMGIVAVEAVSVRGRFVDDLAPAHIAMAAAAEFGPLGGEEEFTMALTRLLPGWGDMTSGAAGGPGGIVARIGLGEAAMAVAGDTIRGGWRAFGLGQAGNFLSFPVGEGGITVASED